MLDRNVAGILCVQFTPKLVVFFINTRNVLSWRLHSLFYFCTSEHFRH